MMLVAAGHNGSDVQARIYAAYCYLKKKIKQEQLFLFAQASALIS